MRKLLCLALCGLPWVSFAGQDAAALLAQSDRARGGNLPGIAWTITLEDHDSDGDSRRVMSAIANDENSRVEYTEPEKMRGQRVLMQGRNMWFVRPGLQRPVPLSPRQRLLGNAAAGDIAATHYAADYTAEPDGSEVIEGEHCAVLLLTAKARNTTYDRIRYWVAEGRKVAVKAEFYTVSGKLFKSARFDYGNSIDFEGRHLPFVSQMVITDAVNASHTTTMRYGVVQVKKLDPSLFELNQ